MFIVMLLLFGNTLGYPVQQFHDNRFRVSGCNKDTSNDIHIYLSISSLAYTLHNDSVVERQVEINWYGGVSQPTDWVGLFLYDPITDPSSPVVQYPVYHSPGWVRTPEIFPRPRLPSNHTSCVGGYWGGYVREGNTLASNCIKVRPTWMVDMKHVIGHQPLWQVFIPGTHDTGAYAEYKGPASDNLMTKYVITQDEDVLTQLLYGVRYLDIRVAYYHNLSTNFWLNHGDVPVHKFEDILNQTVTFAASSDEILLFAINTFEGQFDDFPDAHEELQDLLENWFGDLMAPAAFGANVTLNQLWDTGHRIIVSYDSDMTNDKPFLWLDIEHLWGDVQTLKDLQAYLSEVMSVEPQSQTYMWSAMAELTPEVDDVIFDKMEGLRGAAEMVNRDVTTWFRDLWWADANIVSVDFFHGTDIVDVAIEANVRRMEAELCQNLGVIERMDDEGHDVNYRGPRTQQ